MCQSRISTRASTWRAGIAVIAMLAAFSCTPHAIRSRAANAVDPSDLGAFVDSFMATEMARDRIPGAAFVFVQAGRVVLQRGYGLADVAGHRPVVADSTIWRIGSISKVITATAVMQLVDRGVIDLDAPADRYVRRVSIPHTYQDAVTVRQLLNHTAGFDEIRPGTQALSRDDVLPLDQFLAGRLVRIRPPGQIIAYSTYGMTLAVTVIRERSTGWLFLRRSPRVLAGRLVDRLCATLLLGSSLGDRPSALESTARVGR
jgi:CubicO group peptidase (beta-lactamase class C family)